jgi:hypothetical protein
MKSEPEPSAKGVPEIYFILATVTPVGKDLFAEFWASDAEIVPDRRGFAASFTDPQPGGRKKPPGPSTPAERPA